MALAYSARRATRDLDAVFEPKQMIYEVAHQVGTRHGLPDDWLNDGVKGFLTGPPKSQYLLQELFPADGAQG